MHQCSILLRAAGGRLTIDSVHRGLKLQQTIFNLISAPPIMEHASRRVEALLRHVQSPAEDSSSSSEGPSSSLRAAPAGSFASDLWAVATAPLVETERDGGWLVAKVLSSHGVRFVFTLSGGHISPVLVGAKASGIRIVDVRHEVNAVFAADAVARLTGVPGVAAVTAGPGCTNTITAVKNAAMAQSPIVLIGGAAATLTRGRGALQDIDQISLFAPICKWTASVATARDIVPAMREAFRQAMSGVPGPVFVELPLDVIYPLGEARGGMGLTVRHLLVLSRFSTCSRLTPYSFPPHFSTWLSQPGARARGPPALACRGGRRLRRRERGGGRGRGARAAAAA